MSHSLTSRSVRLLDLPTGAAELGYVAGILDGEGTIEIRKWTDGGLGMVNPSHTVRVSINNTHAELMAYLHGMCGGRLYHVPAKPDKGHVEQWKIQLHGKEAGQFLSAILPYLIVKRGQAMLALELCQLGGVMKGKRRLDPELVTKRETLRLQVQALNGRKSAVRG